MPWSVVCGGCKSKVRIPDALAAKPEALAGKSLKCPKCAQKLKVVVKPKAGAKETAVARGQTKTTAAKAPTGTATLPKKAPAKAAPKPAPSIEDTPRPTPKKQAPAKSAPAKNSAPPAPPPPKPAAKPASPPPVPPPEYRAPTPPPLRPTPRVPPRPAKKEVDEGERSYTKILFGILGGAVLLLGIVWFVFFSSSGLANVSGTVTLDGAPLAAAEVDFAGEDESLGAHQTATDAEGRFVVYGPTNAGIPPGKYKVFIRKMVMPNGKLPEGELGEIARSEGKLKNGLSALYSDVDKSPLRAEVKAGNNKVEFALKAKP